MPTISYMRQGRLGNNLFQYLTCKLFGVMFGHSYVVYRPENSIVLDDSFYIHLCNNYIKDATQFSWLRNTNIYLEGYFQYDTLLMLYRDTLLEQVRTDNDVLIYSQSDLPSGLRYNEIIKENVSASPNTVTVHLRLDDFNYNNNPDIVPPDFYTSILDTLTFDTLFVVCKKPTMDWEIKYLITLQKYNPVYKDQTLLEDIKTLLGSSCLLLSNSTLAWIVYYIDQNNIKQAYIPDTCFHSHQRMTTYRETDVLREVIRYKP